MLGGKETNYISAQSGQIISPVGAGGHFKLIWSQDWIFQYPSRPTIGADLKVVPFHFMEICSLHKSESQKLVLQKN